MPRRDGTGPRGMGAMTGRGLGPCGNRESRGFRYGRGSSYGQGIHSGCGRGRGMGRCAYYHGDWEHPMSQETEKSFLENQKVIFKERLKSIEEKLDNLKEDNE